MIVETGMVRAHAPAGLASIQSGKASVEKIVGRGKGSSSKARCHGRGGYAVVASAPEAAAAALGATGSMTQVDKVARSIREAW